MNELEKKKEIVGWTDASWPENIEECELVDLLGCFKFDEPYNGWVRNPVKVRVTIEEI